MKSSKILSVLSLVIASFTFATGVSAAETKSIEKEVLTTTNVMWEEARNANLAGMFANTPAEMTYVMAGYPSWSKAEMTAMMGAAFDGVSRQDIIIKKEQITVLSDDSALYVADSAYVQYDDAGNVMPSGGDYVISIILQKRDGQWFNIHTHQSFPMQP
ncbi:nuclear transport factor 2 family protein [Vibrio amylolyticus]|uniref:nuclear transport factor 2 family protein n=1 Tax=Vibrio amylolyticus TaxID=2847292 RepID=UPI003551B579